MIVVKKPRSQMDEILADISYKVFILSVIRTFFFFFLSVAVRCLIKIMQYRIRSKIY